MSKLSLLLVLLLSVTCAAKPSKKGKAPAQKPQAASPEIPQAFEKGLRTQCAAPPEAVIQDNEALCLYDKTHPQGVGCCGLSSEFVSDDGFQWRCVKMLCQATCQSPWKPTEMVCKVIAEDVSEEQDL